MIIKARKSSIEIMDPTKFQGYKENLRKALISVSNIVRETQGKKIVITSDHGELLADYGFGNPKFVRPPGYRCKELRIVPWLEIET